MWNIIGQEYPINFRVDVILLIFELNILTNLNSTIIIAIMHAIIKETVYPIAAARRPKPLKINIKVIPILEIFSVILLIKTQ